MKFSQSSYFSCLSIYFSLFISIFSISHNFILLFLNFEELLIAESSLNLSSNFSSIFLIFMLSSFISIFLIDFSSLFFSVLSNISSLCSFSFKIISFFPSYSLSFKITSLFVSIISFSISPFFL